jgi:hypothetical protein
MFYRFFVKVVDANGATRHAAILENYPVDSRKIMILGDALTIIPRWFWLFWQFESPKLLDVGAKLEGCG